MCGGTDRGGFDVLCLCATLRNIAEHLFMWTVNLQQHLLIYILKKNKALYRYDCQQGRELFVLEMVVHVLLDD